jgi:hypothetical protein
MRVIIAGSRNVDGAFALLAINEAIDNSGFVVSEVVSGGCRGVDQVGESWARIRHIPVRVFPAEWGKHGNAAGPKRNELMSHNADALVAIWDGESRGTADMIQRARAHGLKVHIEMVKIT